MTNAYLSSKLPILLVIVVIIGFRQQSVVNEQYKCKHVGNSNYLCCLYWTIFDCAIQVSKAVCKHREQTTMIKLLDEVKNDLDAKVCKANPFSNRKKDCSTIFYLN
ncbi:uncharacterized protein LOC128951582 [Oppia nitens]|uniref:uncharacterized protein LOC128951582 n=1 Tax=Oppia nitens TaxID=1686743 RepID=UPI0023DB2713|nr:uncharacterized protein LOC128951582 [Oppia nitens]